METKKNTRLRKKSLMKILKGKDRRKFVKPIHYQTTAKDV